MADPKKALEELKKKYGGSRGTGSAATDPKSALENLKQKYTPKTPVLADRGITLSGPNYQQPLVAPRVSNPKVKDQGNLLSMDVAKAKDQRAEVDEKVADAKDSLEAERKYWQNQKDMWANSQFRGQKWDEADRELARIDQEISRINNSTFSQDVINEAQSWQKAVADYRAQQETDKMLLQMNLQDAEGYAERLDELKQLLPTYENEMDFWPEGSEKHNAAKAEYDKIQGEIEQLEKNYSDDMIERAVQLQKKAELEGAAKYVGFANMSKYDTSGFQGAEKVIVDGGYEMYVMDDEERIYRLINKDPEAIKVATTNKNAKGIDETYLTMMTPEQTAIYNYWYKTNKAYADEYLEMITPELLQKQMMPRLENIAAMAEESPVASSAISVGLTFASLPAYIGQVADYIDDREIQENAAYNFAPLAQKTIRDTVGTKIEEKLGEKWGKAGSFAYQLGMSMADFLAVAGVGAGGMGTVILGGNAAAQTTLEAKARGLTDGQALALGTISGVAEWATETWSVEKLLDMTALGKSAGGYMLQNITTEGSEEGISGLVNLFADILISKDKSQWQQAIDQYIQNDYDEKSAFAMALSDQVMAIGLDVIGGGISGGIMSAGGVALNEAGYAMSRPSGAYQQRQEIMDAIMKMAEEESLGAEVQTQQVAAPEIKNLEAASEPIAQAVTQEQETEKAALNVTERAAETGGMESAEARSVSDGDKGRLFGERAGGQAGSVGESTAAVQQRAAEQRAKADDRRAKAAVVQLEEISSNEMGLENGTDDASFFVYPENLWDDELQGLAAEAKQKYGVDITYTIGAIPIRKKNGSVGTVRGVWTTDGRMIVQADTNAVATVQVMTHEGWHAKELSPKQLRQIETKIRDQYSADEFERVVYKYMQKLSGVIDIYEGMSRAEYEMAYTRILDEIFANADAGINAFGTNVARYQQTVRQEAENFAPRSQTAQATERTTGPPQTEANEIAEVLQGLREDLKAGNITQEQYEAVRQGFESYSMSEEEKQQRLGDLRSYLAGNMSKQELDRKIGGRTAARQQTGRTMSRDAQNIKKAAARQGISVEEYLHQNWELFDVDGQWNQAAREALDSERGAGGRTEMYSINEEFAADIDEWDENGRPETSQFILGSTGEVLQGLGAIESDIYMNGEKINTILAEHPEMTLREIKRIPEILDDPVLILKSRNAGRVRGQYGEDRLVIFGTVKAQDGRPIMCVLDLRPVENGFFLDDMQKVSSAYTKDTKPVEFISNSEVLYADKKRTIPLLRNTGLKRRVSLLRNGYVGSITYSGQSVKMNGVPFNQVARIEQESYSLDEEAEAQAEETQEQKPKEKKPKEESKPTTAKKDLRNNLLNLFSIPDGMRGDLGAVIDNYADRLLKNGSLTEEDLNQLIDRLYAEGVMEIPADEYYQLGRQAVNRGRIFVPQFVKDEFKGDWNAFRKRAFAAGVILTNDRGDSGIDSWNVELADMLPGLFNERDTDAKLILEHIVQLAEEGKGEKVSLAEYAHQMAEREFVSEDEMLDNLERQVDWALKTFAEKAALEVKLRDRYDVKAFSEYKQEYREREMIRKAAERERRKEMAQQAKENRELKQMQQKTLKQLQWLSKNRFRAPEELKATWDEVLGDIDIYAVGAANEARYSKKYNATWKDLAQMYVEARDNDPNFIPSADLERIVSRINDKKIAELDVDALQNLYRAAVGLRTEFYNRNNVINDEKNRLFAEVYTDSKAEIEAAEGEYTGKKSDKFMNLDQLTPMNVMQRMGGWNPDGTFYSMAKQLEQGERDMRDYEVRANRLLEDFLTENEDWVKKSDGQGKNATWYEIKVHPLMELGHGNAPIFSKETVTVYMTPAQKVHMYLESKNTQNLRHMMGGRTFADKKLYSDGKRQEAFAKGTTVRLAPETVKQIVSDLTEQEMQLAKILENYYNNFATERINKVSNVLNGYDKAMAGNYAPIFTNNNYTKQEFGKFDATAEGVSNLKTRIPFASNPSYNISALDAFERNVGQTARYVGMAIPARNWTSFMSWRTENNSTADVITHKWGQESKDYISNLITDLQAGKSMQSESTSELADKIMSNYISAIFGANPSIVLKQLGSLPMATVYLDLKNIPKPSQLAKIDRDLINKYTSELAWRTMGYTTPETKQLKDNPNWTETNKFTQFTFGGGAITAMDGAAASVLWPWAENKVRREQPDLEVGSQEQIDAGESPFYKEVAKAFNEAVNRSQSVSDQMHQGTLRKSSNLVTKTLTMFKSDASQTYNALRQKIGEARYYKKIGADEETIREANRKVGSVFLNAIGGYSWAALVSFLIAMAKNKGKYYRDDEGELTAASVSQEVVMDVIESMAGIVAGGQEITEAIGIVLTGDTWFGIEAPGIEQIADIFELGIDSSNLAKEIGGDAINIVQNGGDLLKYLKSRGGEILGSMKDIAVAASTYISGVPVKNVEAYLAGTLSWLAPGFAKKYESVFKEDLKNGLKGLSGNALVSKIDSILEERNVDVQTDTAELLASLYEAGMGGAVPSNTPTSVSIDSVEYPLNAYKTQTYETVWGAIVDDVMEQMIQTEVFQNADQKTQEKILNRMYDYASANAKEVVFEQYVPDKWVGAVQNAIQAGLDEATAIAYSAAINAIENDENVKSYDQGVQARALITAADLTDEQKMAIYEMAYQSTAETRVAKFRAMMDGGMSWEDIASVYDKYAELDAREGATASQKATEFAHWIDQTGFTASEEQLIESQLNFWSMSKSEPKRYDKLTAAGLSNDEAKGITEALSALEPLEGKKQVTSAQEYKAIVDYNMSAEKTLMALSTVMGEKEYQRVVAAEQLAVSPKVYAEVKYILPQYDENGNGDYSNEEVEAAIEGYEKSNPLIRLNRGDKAILWQALTGNKSAKNNPYDRLQANDFLDLLPKKEGEE